MEEPNDRVVRTFHLILLGNMTMEGRRGPEGSLRTAGILEFLENFFLLRIRDTRLPSRTLPGYEAVDPIQVEGPDNLLYCTFRKIEGGHGLFSGTARDKQNNDRTSTMGLPVSRPLKQHTTQPMMHSPGSVCDTSGPRFIYIHMSQQMSRNININR